MKCDTIYNDININKDKTKGLFRVYQVMTIFCTYVLFFQGVVGYMYFRNFKTLPSLLIKISDYRKLQKVINIY